MAIYDLDVGDPPASHATITVKNEVLDGDATSALGSPQPSQRIAPSSTLFENVLAPPACLGLDGERPAAPAHQVGHLPHNNVPLSALLPHGTTNIGERPVSAVSEPTVTISMRLYTRLMTLANAYLDDTRLVQKQLHESHLSPSLVDQTYSMTNGALKLLFTHRLSITRDCRRDARCAHINPLASIYAYLCAS